MRKTRTANVAAFHSAFQFSQLLQPFESIGEHLQGVD